MAVNSGIIACLLLILAVNVVHQATSASAQALVPLMHFSGLGGKVLIDGAYLIIGNVDVTIWDVNSHEVSNGFTDIFTGFIKPIVAMSVLDRFLYAVSSDEPMSMCKWDYLTGEMQWCVTNTGNTVTDLVVSSNGVYTSATDGTIKRWDLITGTLISTVQAATAPSGFVGSILKLLVDRGTNRLYASFGRYKLADGIGLATLVPSGDFEDVTTADRFDSTGTLGAWETSLPVGGYTVYVDTPISYNMVAPRGSYALWFRIWRGSLSTLFIRQTLSFVPGHFYRLRFWYASYYGGALPTSNTLEICGMPVAVAIVLPSNFNFNQISSELFQSTGKSCVVQFLSTGCDGGSYCEIGFDYIEIVLVQRHANFDNMEVIPVTNGGFEGITTTTTSAADTGTYGAWTKTGGTGTVAIARVGSADFFNLPAAAGLYTLWMQTVTGSDTTVSQTVSLAPGVTHMVRWHFAMRHISGTNTVNPVSSLLRVTLCGVVVANNFAAPSLLFEEASSSLYTPIGTTAVSCALELTIIRGVSTLRSLLIDEVELVRVRNPNLVPSGGFEGLTATTTSLNIFPGIMVGSWTSGGHSTGRAVIVRIPSMECDNLGSIASPYALWLQSSNSAPGTSMSVPLNTFVTGSTYVVRWLFSLRKQGTTTFNSPSLSISVFRTTVASGKIPTSAVFTPEQSSEFVASGPATTLTLIISVEAVTSHILIDDVEIVPIVVDNSPPFVREYGIGASSLTRIRDFSFPGSWLETLPAGTVPGFGALTTASGRLYTGMSFSQAGTSCHVLEYNTVGGLFMGARTMRCNGGSVRSIAASGGQLYVGHVNGIFQVALADSSYSRQLEWFGGTSNNGSIVDLAADGVYIVAAGDDLHVKKWFITAAPFTPLATTTSTTSTSTTSSSTTTTSTSTTRTSARTSTTSRTSSAMSTSTMRTVVTIRTTTSTRTATTSTTITTSSIQTSSTMKSTSITSAKVSEAPPTTKLLDPQPSDTPDVPNSGDQSGSLSTLELVFIAVGSSALFFVSLGSFLYVRRMQQEKRRLRDYEMAKSSENLRRSEMELGKMGQSVSLSQSSLGEMRNVNVVQTYFSAGAKSHVVAQTLPQAHSTPLHGPNLPATSGPIGGQNFPAKTVPVATPFSNVFPVPPLPQNDRPLPNSAPGSKHFSPSNSLNSDSRYRMPSNHGSSSQIRMATQRSVSSRTVTSHTSRSIKQMSLLSQVVNTYHNRRSLESTMRSGQTEASSKLTRQSDRTNFSQRTLVDREHHGLEIPGFLQLDKGADYQMYNEFASGGGGSVFRGRMLAPIISNMKVVVKKIKSTNLPAFRQEVALMWLFHDDDNLVKLIGFNEFQFEIVMPEYTMGSLERFITTCKYTSTIAVSLALDVAKGIMAMHTRGIVHQDIKTDNVLLEQHPTKGINAVITDFGISNVVEDTVLKVKAFEVKNVRGLTARYAAPEAIFRFRTKERTPVSPPIAKAGDVYSLAIIVHTLLMGKMRLK